MARSHAKDATVAIAFETAYGQDPGGNYKKIPLISCSLGATQGLIESDIIGMGRDPQQPSRDVVNVDGDIVVPEDQRDFGFWLEAAFGPPTTVDNLDGTRTHTFLSGAATLPSLAIEVGHPSVPAFFLELGNKVDRLSLEFRRSGHANATIGLIGQSETRNTATSAGTPTTQTFSRYSQFQGAIKRNGAALANAVSGSLAYANNLDRVEVIRSDGRIEAVDAGIAACTGQITARFDSVTFLDDAASFTPIELVFERVIDATHFLRWTVHEVYLPKPKVTIEGPGGIQATFDWQAADDAAAGQMLTCALRNDVASY